MSNLLLLCICTAVCYVLVTSLLWITNDFKGKGTLWVVSNLLFLSLVVFAAFATGLTIFWISATIGGVVLGGQMERHIVKGGLSH
jgi:hypothetical protein